MATRSIQEGFHEQTREVSALTAGVAGTRDGWERGEPLAVPGAQTVSKIYADLSALIATYGNLAQKDAQEFDDFGVSIVVQDEEDAAR